MFISLEWICRGYGPPKAALTRVVLKERVPFSEERRKNENQIFQKERGRYEIPIFEECTKERIRSFSRSFKENLAENKKKNLGYLLKLPKNTLQRIVIRFSSQVRTKLVLKGYKC